jgi:hypothetical protein
VRHTLTASFFDFSPFKRVPLGSFESLVIGWLFFRGAWAMYRSKALFTNCHRKTSNVPSIRKPNVSGMNGATPVGLDVFDRLMKYRLKL